jgi:hypothetical protein
LRTAGTLHILVLDLANPELLRGVSDILHTSSMYYLLAPVRERWLVGVVNDRSVLSDERYPYLKFTRLVAPNYAGRNI